MSAPKSFVSIRFLPLIAIAATALVGSPALADEVAKASKPDFSRTAEIVEQAVKDHIFPGCSVAVGNHSQVLWARGFGRLDYEQGAEVTPETLYDLASVTKIIGTTSVVLTLVRDGKLAVTDPVSRYVPEFLDAAKVETDKQRRAKVTIEHLLTHSSGLPAGAPLYKKAETYDGIIKQVFATPLEAEPGARSVYSDLGVMLLGEVAARAGGKRLADLEQERIFAPLGLHDTMRNPPAALIARIAPTERRGDGKGFWQGVVHDENARAGEGLTAHAGIFSTADDMARWSAEWLKGTRGESKIFPEALVEQFTRRREIVKDSSRALGWDTPPGSAAGKKLSSHAFGHTGFTGTNVWIDPEADVYVILLANAVHPKRGDLRIQKVRRGVADAVLEAVAGK
ncbi:MAG TPA: serine hydrolase domain-containing protein [Pirellulales bacterium]|nr:serine hydrolase domain-containing protein [Pirellulales bacterium]